MRSPRPSAHLALLFGVAALLVGSPGAFAQDLIELVKIDVIFPGRPEANTTLLPDQDNVWDLRISEPYRVFVTYRMRLHTETIGNVELVQRRTDTGEEKPNGVTAPTGTLSGHLPEPFVITATGPGDNGAPFSVAFREGDEFRGLAPPLEYQLFLITNVVADKHLNPLARSEILTVRPPAADADYEISGIEVLQTVQDSAGSVPLVANKPTVARVYVQAAEGSTPGNDRVSARLSGRQVGGERLGTISPRFRNRFVRPTGADDPPDRDKATSSLIYVLPDSWTQAGRLALEAELDIETIPVSDDLSNNITRTSALFSEKRTLNVAYLPLCLKSTGGTEAVLCPQPRNMTLQELLAEDLLPLPENGIRYFEASDFVLSSLLGGAQQLDQAQAFESIHLIPSSGPAGSFMRMRRGVVNAQLVPFAMQRVQLAAALNPDVDAFAVLLPKGARQFDSDPLAGSINPRPISTPLSNTNPPMFLMPADPTFQGEVSFAGNLAIVLGGDPALPGCRTGFKTFPWPTEDFTIAATDVAGSQDAVGFDVPALELKPSSLKDVTTECGFEDVWISGLNATKLFRLFPGPSAGLNPERETLQSTGEILLLLAGFQPDGSAAGIESLTRVSSAMELAPSQVGDYCAEIHNPGGRFASECFQIPDTQDSDIPAGAGFFVSSALPFPADATGIRLTYQGNVLLERTPSANAPTVTFTAPSPGDRWEGGEQEITWNGADSDGDGLVFNVFASTDGGATWQPVATSLEATELTLNADLLDAGELSLRVVANDGFHTSEAVVGPITVVTTPAIEAPSDLDLGFAVVEDVAMGELRIGNSGQGRLQIDEVVVDNPSFEVLRVPDPFRILAGTDAPLRLRYLPTAVGAETAVLTIRSNAANSPELSVNLRAEAVDPETPTIAVSSELLDLGDVPVNELVTGSVAVTSTGLAELTVEAAVAGEGFTAPTPGPFVLEPGEQQAVISVGFQSAIEGAFDGTLMLASNDPNQPVVEVALVARAVSASGGPGSGGPRPAISANGVRNAATFQPGMVEGSWVTIFGDNLAETTRTWDGAIEGSTLPTVLDGVEVLIGGKSAAIFFISPNQLNVQVPDGLPLGQTDVQVVLNGVAGEPFRVELHEVAPGFFLFDPENRKYLAAVHLDGVFVGKEGLFGGAVATRPARPGERVLLFGTGFGPTDPPTPAGVIPEAAGLAGPVTVTIGGVEASVEFAGVVGAGLYQLNVVIPAGLPEGDAEVLLTVAGVSSPAATFLTIAP